MFNKTYIAILAAQLFRAFIVIMIYFSFELKQYNYHLAYFNTFFKKLIYGYCFYEYNDKNQMLKILKILYGLKESRHLWSLLFTQTLEKLGLEPIFGVNCLYTNGWMLLIFFINDIFMVFSKAKQLEYDKFEYNLLSKFIINYLEKENHFLNIRIIREKVNQKTYLIQDSYIIKLGSKYHIIMPIRFCKAPLPLDILISYN